MMTEYWNAMHVGIPRLDYVEEIEIDQGKLSLMS